jgi:DNA sulfur modification protein DndE
MVWILGRTYSSGTPEDYAIVHKIQSQYRLTPLSYFGKTYTPPKGTINPSIDEKTPVRDQVNRLDAAKFFNKLALLMKDNPPTVADAPVMAKFAKIGLVTGKPFTLNTLEQSVSTAIEGAPKKALAQIAAHEKDAGTTVNGWLITTNTGSYGTNYLQRAFITLMGLGANLPEDAIYPTTRVDSQGQTLDGNNAYVLHFPKEQLPPVNGFWSLTLYNEQLFFSANPLNRFTLSPRNNLKYNADGSLELYIQNASPGKDQENNWLPAPKGKFVLTLRLYWPKEEVINGTWTPPGVQKR